MENNGCGGHMWEERGYDLYNGQWTRVERCGWCGMERSIPVTNEEGEMRGRREEREPPH